MKIEVQFLSYVKGQSTAQAVLTAMTLPAREWCDIYSRNGVTLTPSQVRAGRYFLPLEIDKTEFFNDFLAAGGTLCEPEHD